MTADVCKNYDHERENSLPFAADSNIHIHAFFTAFHRSGKILQLRKPSLHIKPAATST